MSRCKFCALEIEASARKCHHCLSFQDDSDAPKQSYDLAAIVISFVGVIATIGTIAGAIFGYFGFHAIGDINETTKNFNQQVSSFGSTIAELGKNVTSLKEQAGNVRSDLNGITINQNYDRFQQLFDQILLDYVYNYAAKVSEMSNIASSSVALQPAPEVALRQASEMKIIARAITDYGDALKDNDEDGFLAIATSLEKVSDDNLGKNRLLIGCYSHLHDLALRTGNLNQASIYFNKEKHYALAALHSAQHLNRTATIAKVNYASTLIEGGNPQEMERGYTLLLEARKDAPQIAGIHYNIATYFAKKNKFDDALQYLEQAKNLGDFATCDDVLQWLRDKDFDTLRLSEIQTHKARINMLEKVSNGPC